MGRPHSPFAITKYLNVLCAAIHDGHRYGPKTIGLRYLNVFGPRQDLFGQYATVILRWANKTQKRGPGVINEDSETSRDSPIQLDLGQSRSPRRGGAIAAN